MSATVFERFCSQPEEVQALRKALDTLCYTDFGCWMSLTLKYCNAMCTFGSGGPSFSEAFVEAEGNTNVSEDSIYRFGLVFKKYREELHELLDDPTTMPSDNTVKLLFSKLLEYILDKDQQEVLQNRIQEYPSECEVAATLAEHVFSRLSVSPRYTLNSHYKCSKFVSNCPCGCGADVTQHYGDTSVGNPQVWHGNLDIMLGSLPVIVGEDELNSLGGKLRNQLCQESSEEVKNNIYNEERLENPEFTNQLISQSIVFSFLQRKHHPELSNFLIPTVGANKSCVVFYMYDSENDILLRSPCFKLLSYGEVSIQTILAIWFVVNYQFLCTGLDLAVDFKNVKKANFFQLAESVLPVYQKDLSLGGVHSIRTVKEYLPMQLKCDSIKEEPPAKKTKN